MVKNVGCPSGALYVFVVFQQSFPDAEILVGDKDVVRLLLLFQPASLHRDERQQEFSVGRRLDVPCRDGQGLPVFVAPVRPFVEKDRAAGIVYHVNVVFIHRETPEVMIFPFAMPEASMTKATVPSILKTTILRFRMSAI